MKLKIVYFSVFLFTSFKSFASPPDLTNWIIAPNVGESYLLGSTISVTIDGNLYTPPTIVVELYKGSTRVWGPSYAGVSNRIISTEGLTNGTDYRVKIYNASNPSEEDYSSYFSIGSTTGFNLTNWLTSPAGGENYSAGSTISVTIDGNLYTPTALVVELYKGSTRVWGPSFAGISNRTIPTTGLSSGTDYRVKIYNASNPSEADYSNYFSITSTTVPNLTNWIVSPNGGESYPLGSSISISIDNTLYDTGGSGISIELYKGNTRVWGPSIAGISGRTIPTTGLTIGTDYKVHIYNANNSTEEDYSNGYFSIRAVPDLANWLLSPNGGESYVAGSTISLSIDGDLYSAGGCAIAVEIYKGNTRVTGSNHAGVSGRTISTVGLAEGSDYRVHIYNACEASEEDFSNSYFSLTGVDITNWIEYPNGGESFASGTSIPLRVRAYSAPDAMQVELYKGSALVGGDGTGGNYPYQRTISTQGLAAGSDYKVRVNLASRPDEYDWSDNYFSITGSSPPPPTDGGTLRPGPTTTGASGCAGQAYSLSAIAYYTGSFPTGFRWFTSQSGTNEVSPSSFTSTGYSWTSTYQAAFTNTVTFWVATVYENNPTNLSERSPVTFTLGGPTLSSSMSVGPISSGSFFTYTPTSAIAGTTFVWSRAAVLGIKQLASSGNESINEFLTNTTVDPINVTYLFLGTANGCTGSSLVTVTVNPLGPNNYNYIISRDIQSAKKANGSAINEADVASLPVYLKAENTTYFDGLGRPMQSVATQASPSPNKLDIVTPIVYDQFGREKFKFLPIATGSDGGYKPNETMVDPVNGGYINDAASFYGRDNSTIASDSRPFSETIFEPSPLNRPAQQFGPGQAWNDSRDPNNRIEKPITHGYLVNTLNEVYLFGYDVTAGLITWAGASSAAGFYDAGQLYANKTTDEQGHEVIEYVDKEGHTVCKKVEASGSGSSKVYASTYYIYDDLGNLVVVLPPEGVKELTK